MIANLEPEEEDLEKIVQFIKQSQSPHTQTDVQQKLEELSKYPYFNCYLIFVLTKLTSQDEQLRALSGQFLKNNIERYFHEFSPEVIKFIKKHCIDSVGDRSPLIRTTISILITTIVSKVELINWPELLPELCSMLDSNESQSCEGAFGALQKICQDSPQILDGDSLNFLIPKFLQFLKHDNSKIRSHALVCVSQFITSKTQALILHIDFFIENLFHLGSDQDAEIRKNVCKALVMLLEVQMDTLIPHIRIVIEHMIMRIQDQDENVVLEACEFWLSLAEQPTCKEILSDYLNGLIEILEEIKSRINNENTINVGKQKLNDNDDDNDDVEFVLQVFDDNKIMIYINDEQQNDFDDDDDFENISRNSINTTLQIKLNHILFLLTKLKHGKSTDNLNYSYHHDKHDYSTSENNFLLASIENPRAPPTENLNSPLISIPTFKSDSNSSSTSVYSLTINNNRIQMKILYKRKDFSLEETDIWFKNKEIYLQDEKFLTENERYKYYYEYAKIINNKEEISNRILDKTLIALYSSAENAKKGLQSEKMKARSSDNIKLYIFSLLNLLDVTSFDFKISLSFVINFLINVNKRKKPDACLVYEVNKSKFCLMAQEYKLPHVLKNNEINNVELQLFLYGLVIFLHNENVLNSNFGQTHQPPINIPLVLQNGMQTIFYLLLIDENAYNSLQNNQKPREKINVKRCFSTSIHDNPTQLFEQWLEFDILVKNYKQKIDNLIKKIKAIII